jgi:hypothetical protein
MKCHDVLLWIVHDFFSRAIKKILPSSSSGDYEVTASGAIHTSLRLQNNNSNTALTTTTTSPKERESGEGLASLCSTVGSILLLPPSFVHLYDSLYMLLGESILPAFSLSTTNSTIHHLSTSSMNHLRRRSDDENDDQVLKKRPPHPHTVIGVVSNHNSIQCKASTTSQPAEDLCSVSSLLANTFL